MKPLISIITPTHNIQSFIGECIDSVLSQSYKNWEMIIIDDCSIDGTYKLAKEYALKDKRIKVFRHNTNWGIPRLSDTYNQALSMVRGEVVAVLEGDDLWPAYKLERQNKVFTDKQVVLSYGDSITISSRGNPFKIVYYRDKPKAWLSNDPPGSILYAFKDLNFCFEPQTVMIRKSALEKIGGFKKHHIFPFVDYPTWFHLSLVGKFAYFNEVAGYYRKHSGSEWFKFSLTTKARVRQEVQQCFIDFIELNRKKMEQLGVKIKEKDLVKEESRTIHSKKKRESLSILLHYIVFEDKEGEMLMIQKILKSNKESLYVKTIAMFFLITFPIQSVLIFFQFKLRYLYYRLTRSILT